MRAVRLTAILAFAAALMAAPSSVSAVTPNRLFNPSCLPASGALATTVVVSVRYASAHGNRATAVTASAASRNVTLVLLSGSRADGLWTGDILLPAGSWTITFSADAERGPDPTTTCAPVPAAPAPSGTPSNGSVDSGGPSIAPSPVAAPASPAAPTSTPAAAPAASEPPSPGATGGDDPALAASSQPAAATSSAAVDADPVAGEAHRRPGNRAPRATPSATQSADAALPGAVLSDGDDMAVPVLGFGMLGVAAVALAGLLWLVLARRREAAHEAAVAEPSTEALLAERTVRRARRRSSEDPIMRAMGLDDEEPTG